MQPLSILTFHFSALLFLSCNMKQRSLILGFSATRKATFVRSKSVVVSSSLSSSASSSSSSSSSSSGLPPNVPPNLPPSSGYDAVLSDQTFRELYSEFLPDWLIGKCETCGWTSPTLIQQRALDSYFHDDPNSMVIQAQTGSGKTLTYLLPLLARLEERAAIQAMIVVPTRELGLQVATIAKRLASRKFMIMSLLQGSTLKRQRAWAWAETPQVVIGTPTELLDMVQYAGLPRVNSVEYVAVDEVDACLMHNSGTIFDTTASTKISSSSSLHVLLSKYLSPTYLADNDGASSVSSMFQKSTKQRRKFRYRQTLFCSATIPQHRHFLKQCRANQWTLEEPVFICTSPGEALPPTLKHAYMVCQSNDKKLATLRRLILKLSEKSNRKVLVFCDPARPMEDMSKALAFDLGGNCYQEGKELPMDKPIVSVLRYENSLSQRAGAKDVFAKDNDNYDEENDENNNITSEDTNTSNDVKNPFRVMLTTDLAARGLDILSITHVVHLDIPPISDTYLHRSGRAGRLGRSGQVVSIITADQEFVLQRLANALSLDITCIGKQKKKPKLSSKREFVE